MQSNVIDILCNGGVVLMPTDTVYGLVCNAFNQSGVNKIYNIKNRDRVKKLSIFCKNLEMIKLYCIVNSYQSSIISQFLPGKFTFILQLNELGLSNFKYITHDDTIGVRIPDNKLISDIFLQIDFPLASTSANISNAADSSIFNKISQEIVRAVDCVIKDDVSTENQASSVIDIREYPHRYNILRKGELIDNFVKFYDKN